MGGADNGVNEDELFERSKEARRIASEILTQREEIRKEREVLNAMKKSLISEMRLKQISTITVGDFNFEVELEDKVTVKKKAKPFKRKR
jgi:hypothetical protein